MGDDKVKDVKDVLERFNSGTSTDEELELALLWLHQLETRSDHGLSEAELDTISQQIRKNLPLKTRAPYVRRFGNWKWAGIAASLLLVLGAATWIYFDKTTNTQVEDFYVGRDLAPGGSKAVLIVDDKQSISLNDASGGVLLSVNGTEVKKENDGQLKYEGAEAPNKKVDYHQVITPRGGEYHLTLLDGTQVFLNSESSIRFPVPFADSVRAIEVTGEVYFEVAKDAKKAFVVSSGDAKVRVYGTKFIVSDYEDEQNRFKISLLEGSVNVSNQDGDIMMSPGQQVIKDSGNHLTFNTNVNMTQETDWINGVFVFDHATVPEIMNRIGRWYNVEITYEGEVSNETISGIVSRNSDVSEILKLFEGAGIRFHVDEKEIIVKY